MSVEALYDWGIPAGLVVLSMVALGIAWLSGKRVDEARAQEARRHPAE
ncbi:MAG: hypothetical protein AAF409_14840 [Pseudomonadota bacterium]